MKQFNVEIYTQERKLYEGEVNALRVPAEEGALGILANHAPLMTTLGEGLLRLTHGGEVTEHRISGGFLEVHGNKATVLADRVLED